MRLGNPLVERESRGGHGRSLDKRITNGAVVNRRTHELIYPVSCRHLATGLHSWFLPYDKFPRTFETLIGFSPNSSNGRPPNLFTITPHVAAVPHLCPPHVPFLSVIWKAWSLVEAFSFKGFSPNPR